MRSLSLSEETWCLAQSVIPGGTMTESKKPSKYVDGVYPKYIKSAQGATVKDVDGNTYVDFISAPGAITVGYETHASSGTFSLPSPREVELAYELDRVIPCAQKSKFFKTGSEACSAAIKAARALTGRDGVLACGYHGWHDWYSIANDKKKGIPKDYSRHVQKFRYNDLEDLRKKLTSNVACVIMEPVIYDEPGKDYLQRIQQMCKKNGTLLIFDEMVTGFRMPGLSAQSHYGVCPDMTTIGKGMANGVPMAAVCGLRDAMDIFADPDFFCSGTYNSDLGGIEASLKTIGVLRQFNGRISAVGRDIKSKFNSYARGLGIKAECRGLPCRTFFDFPTAEHKSLFWQECVERGVLFGYANFPTVAHQDYLWKDAGYVYGTMGDALRIVAKHWDFPAHALKGATAQEVFRLVR